MCTLGVTTMSAESHVNPGGYHTYPQALEQFTVSDERTAKVINARLKELGREPVWKDWDASFDLISPPKFLDKPSGRAERGGVRGGLNV
jgi:2-iminoacetate synthase